MKKVLLVSYVFPPMAAVGGQRIVKFCKFLPGYGWTPVVLTVKKGVNSSWDYSLLEEVRDVATYRSRSFEPVLRRSMKQGSKTRYSKSAETRTPAVQRMTFIRRLKRLARNLLSVPDFAILWIPFGVLKGLRVIRREKIEAILSSSPPVSSHIIGSILARLTGLPQIADFRDLWTLNHVYPENGYPNYIVKYDRFWERFVLRGADWVTTASPGFTAQMKEHFGGILGNRIRTITNGFDYSEIDLRQHGLRKTADSMKFLYTGSLYSHFNPVFFLETLSEWIGSGKSKKVRCDFYGDSDYDYNGYAADLGLEDVVFFHGHKSRLGLLPLLDEADCLLLFLGFEAGCANVIPAKLFEYLASGAPILALAPEGVCGDIISRYEAGYVISEPDKKMMTDCLDDIYEAWVSDRDERRGFRYIEEIDRQLLTGHLAELLDNAEGESQDRISPGIRRGAM